MFFQKSLFLVSNRTADREGCLNFGMEFPENPAKIFAFWLEPMHQNLQSMHQNLQAMHQNLQKITFDPWRSDTCLKMSQKPCFWRAETETDSMSAEIFRCENVLKTFWAKNFSKSFKIFAKFSKKNQKFQNFFLQRFPYKMAQKHNFCSKSHFFAQN